MLKSNENKKWFVAIMAIVWCLAAAGPVQASTGWLQKTKLLAADGAADDYFGISVSISGDYAIVGAYGDDNNGYNSGSAYIFKWDGTSLVQQQKILASDGATGDLFGHSVSISGDLAIVGAYYGDGNEPNCGSAYIFRWNGTNWVEQAKLTASDGAADDYFGWSVSIDADYAIVGAKYDDDKGGNSGSAYIFRWNGTSWSEQQKLLASDGAGIAYFGDSVSISGDYAIVGASNSDNHDGSAYIFKWDGTSWVQQQKLFGDGHFGCSASISGDLAIVGAAWDIGWYAGSACIFKWNGTSWSWQQKLFASDGADWDYFGYSVSISGDYAIVGAYGDDNINGSASGSAYIFRWDGTSWVQEQKLLASDGASSDCFGKSVSISGDYAIVGAPYDYSTGSAYIFVGLGTGALKLLAPNGGEELVAGSTYDITWDTNGVVESVFIEYSDNNGVDWTVIDTVPNIGSYPWLVPDVNSNECLVWISDAGHPGSNDISDDVFRIYVCTLDYDLNHDCLIDFYDFALVVSEWLKCGDPCDPNCQP